MKIEHVCLNVSDIERMKAFYCEVFGFASNQKYHNDKTGWENYFLSSEEGGARLELLSKAALKKAKTDREATCIVHFSLALGSKENISVALKKAVSDGASILGQPRMTGDGYYEASILDPEGNMVELTL
jgi:lactoylglutathione lyase